MSDQYALFDVHAPDTGRPARRSKWGGADSQKARAKCRAMLPYPCMTCGGVITAEDPESSWHAGHRTDRADTGNHKDTDVEPQHAHCNTSEGGKRGAAITNARQHAPHLDRSRVAQWW